MLKPSILQIYNLQKRKECVFKLDKHITMSLNSIVANK